MNLLFPFASLGVINGILVSLYLLFRKGRTVSDYYFAGLILAFCLRIGKSVLLYYADSNSLIIRQIGLSACIFIGPFFYLYLRSIANPDRGRGKLDGWLLVSLLVFIVGIGWAWPYPTYHQYWNPEIVQVIYGVWAVFLILGLHQAYLTLGEKILTPWNLTGDQRYLATIVYAMILITLSYQLALYLVSFTYIWGSFIFSGSFYILGYRALKNRSVAAKPNPKPVADGDAIMEKLNRLMEEQKPYTNQDLKMDELALETGLSRHVISQVLNERYSGGYSDYIKQYRVREAKELIVTHSHLSLEGIGYEAGFRSKSAFFESFKRMESLTPAAYRKQVLHEKSPE